MIQGPPQELLGHFGRTRPVGMGQAVAAGRRGSANGGQRPRPQLEGVAEIIESNAMSQLRVQQADGVAPRTKSARLLFHASLPRYLGDFVFGNKIANLTQDVALASCWFDRVFHACRVAGLYGQANTFLGFSVGWLCPIV